MDDGRLDSLSDEQPIQPEQVELLDLRDAGPSHPQRRGLYAPRFRQRYRLVIALFVLTAISTFAVGMIPSTGPTGPYLLLSPAERARHGLSITQLIENGAVFCTALMGILLFHEFGHYFQARRYGVPATLPYFIPFPFSPFGTMGAVIVQGAGTADRKALFDIAVTGPLAGLLVAIPVTWFGVQQTGVYPAPAGGVLYGDPLLLTWMIEAAHGPVPPGYEANFTPLLFAGWVGLFITALNLMPVGQLDGGHILYALIGRRAHYVALAVMGAAIGFMIVRQYYAYSLLIVLLFLMGPKHPPTVDDNVPLGPVRIVIGWLTLAFIIVGFTPTPMIVN